MTCTPTSNGSADAAEDSEGEVIQEIDFALWAETDFAAGGNITYNLDGGSGVLPWTGASTENADSGSATNGGIFRRDDADVGDDGAFGLRVFHDPSVNTSLLAASAPRLTIPLPTLIDDYDETRRYRLEVMVSRVALSSAGVTPNTARCFAGIFGAAGAPTGASLRQLAAMLYNNGGVHYHSLQGANPAVTGAITAFSYVTAPPGNFNVLAMQWGPEQVATTFAGLYSGGWPEVPARPLRTTGAQIYIAMTAAVNNAPINSREMLFTLGSAVGTGTTGSVDYMFRRARVIALPA